MACCFLVGLGDQFLGHRRPAQRLVPFCLQLGKGIRTPCDPELALNCQCCARNTRKQRPRRESRALLQARGSIGYGGSHAARAIMVPCSASEDAGQREGTRFRAAMSSRPGLIMMGAVAWVQVREAAVGMRLTDSGYDTTILGRRPRWLTRTSGGQCGFFHRMYQGSRGVDRGTTPTTHEGSVELVRGRGRG